MITIPLSPFLYSSIEAPQCHKVIFAMSGTMALQQVLQKHPPPYPSLPAMIRNILPNLLSTACNMQLIASVLFPLPV